MDEGADEPLAGIAGSRLTDSVGLGFTQHRQDKNGWFAYGPA